MCEEALGAGGAVVLVAGGLGAADPRDFDGRLRGLGKVVFETLCVVLLPRKAEREERVV